MENLATGHWADIYAEKMIREKGEKDLYVCASGITPSGTVHIGNFREIISVDLVVRALRARGKKVRFIYSWDDYDVFRKVPENLPEKEVLEQYLRQPLTRVRDVLGRAENYARGNEIELERLLPLVGIFPEFIYQAQRYSNSYYADDIRCVLQHRTEIKQALDAYRTTPLKKDWWPVSVFCHHCYRDETELQAWDGDWMLEYKCHHCNHYEITDLRKAHGVKLPWRIDWPMRWVKEDVDFEPAGKDHHSEGGSFDTSRKIAQILGGQAPVSFQYDFIRIKGGCGKISSSSGNALGLDTVLEVYTPEVVRFLFASARPNAEFAISFDLDVLKIYEDYDKCERIYYGLHPANEKERRKQSRIYELSQVNGLEATSYYQVSFRHLTTLVQTYDGDIDRALESLKGIAESQKRKLRARAICSWNWVKTFAPEDFRFCLRKEPLPVPLNTQESVAIKALVTEIESRLDSFDEKGLNERIHFIAQSHGLAAKDFFRLIYQVLVGKDQGPRLAHFMLIVGKEKLLFLFSCFQ